VLFEIIWGDNRQKIRPSQFFENKGISLMKYMNLESGDLFGFANITMCEHFYIRVKYDRRIIALKIYVI